MSAKIPTYCIFFLLTTKTSFVITNQHNIINLKNKSKMFVDKNIKITIKDKSDYEHLDIFNNDLEE